MNGGSGMDNIEVIGTLDGAFTMGDGNDTVEVIGAKDLTATSRWVPVMTELSLAIRLPTPLSISKLVMIVLMQLTSSQLQRSSQGLVPMT